MAWYYADGWTNDTSGSGTATAAWQPNNYSYGGRIQSVDAGTCTRISVRVARGSGGSAGIKIALYDGSGNLITSGSTAISSTSMTWVEVSISESVTAGTYHVLYSAEDANVETSYSSSATGKYVTHAYAAAWPDPASFGDESNLGYGAKMDVTVSSGTTGTAAQTLPSVTQSAAGDLSFSGTAAQSLPSITQSASAAAGTSGTAAQTLPSIVQSSAASEGFTGTAAQSLPSVTQAAEATIGAPAVTGTAAQTLPSVTQAATTVEAFSGTSSQTLPSVTQSADGTAGEQPITGTAAQTLPAIVQSATATEAFSAAAAQTLPSVTQVAAATAGEQPITGTAAQTLPSIVQAATAAETFSVSAAQTLPAITQAASAVEEFIAGSAQTLPSITQSADGTTAGAAITGTTAQTLPSASQSAVGVTDTSGTIAQTLPSLTQSADAEIVGDNAGTIEQILPSLAQSASSINIGSEKLPWFPGPSVVTPNTDPASIRQYLQSVSGVANRANIGKINVVLDIVLESGSGTTTVTDKRLSQFSGASFDPMTANAAAEQAAGTLYVTPANRRSGEWTITHANNAQTDRRFRMVVLG